MMITFDKSSNIFDIEPFIKDEVTFNLMHRIRDDDNPLMMKSENGKIIMAQSSPKYPVWIWTDKSIEENEYEELADDFYNLFCDRTKLTFVAKPQIAEFIANNYAKRRGVNWKTSICMESYCCPVIISPRNINGSINKPSLEDIGIIAEFLVGFIEDCFNINTTIDKQIEIAREYILSDNFYVWKVGNKIVSMANIAHRSPRHGRINEVYTPLSQRKKGYASALVSEISKIIYRENRIPMLYTDLSNPASNKAYKNVGFIECGRVNQISFGL
ncbi:GNAT family N-acetyltransferase [Tissierella sp. MSJ-40]|uniref:GNAT family N-acetyltransferase n=1 Tax=Tissierella simiarum TaxID=2841534 RepID=A0ABS6E741_9FIRM|nr:GNAT family N-acetyltransferase [Tissierella simiarum]MBU5438733.1 GNAT family N-acetyltransferase [Tissierella simiarum]